MLLHAHFGDKPTRGQSSGGLVNSLTTVNSPTATFFKLQKDFIFTLNLNLTLALPYRLLNVFSCVI